jgi:hypothetical protein
MNYVRSTSVKPNRQHDRVQESNGPAADRTSSLHLDGLNAQNKSEPGNSLDPSSSSSSSNRLDCDCDAPSPAVDVNGSSPGTLDSLESSTEYPDASVDEYT